LYLKLLKEIILFKKNVMEENTAQTGQTCQKCGRSAEKTKSCKSCNTKTKEETKKCDKCEKIKKGLAPYVLFSFVMAGFWLMVFTRPL